LRRRKIQISKFSIIDKSTREKGEQDIGESGRRISGKQDIGGAGIVDLGFQIADLRLMEIATACGAGLAMTGSLFPLLVCRIS